MLARGLLGASRLSVLRTAPLAPRALAARGLAGKIVDGENVPPLETPELAAQALSAGGCVWAGEIPDNESIATGMEAKEIQGTADIFWSREPITGPKGTKENPAIIPSFNDHRVVGLEIEQARGVLFRLRVRLHMRALHQMLHAILRIKPP